MAFQRNSISQNLPNIVDLPKERGQNNLRAEDEGEEQSESSLEMASKFVLRQVLRGNANCKGLDLIWQCHIIAPPVQYNCLTFTPGRKEYNIPLKGIAIIAIAGYWWFNAIVGLCSAG